jgi:predicted glutamine amidotransferase
MCLIIAKKKRTPYNHDFIAECIRESAIINNDGFGYAVKNEKGIYLSKAQDTYEDLIDELKQANIKDNEELIIHLRKSSSENTKSTINTQPFIIDCDENVHTNFTQFTTTKDVFCHNGFLSRFADYYLNKHFSDTYLFNSTLLGKYSHETDIFILTYFRIVKGIKPIRFIDPYYFAVDSKEVLTRNKFAFLRQKHDLTLLGDFHQNNGFYFSNKSYEKKVKDERENIEVYENI